MSEKHAHAPIILMVEPDDDVRPLLRNNLHRQGYRAIVTLDEEDAIARARGVRDRPDLILINQYLLPLEKVINIGRRIRQDGDSPAARRLSLWLSDTGRIWKARTLRWAKAST